MKTAMIPVRMGSQRLKRKNLREINGVPLITYAIRRARAAGVFDEIWVNSEHLRFGEIAEQEGVKFHKRPLELGSNTATHEEYIYEFLKAHACDYLFQVHSIAPLLTAGKVAGFVNFMVESDYDVLMSVVSEQIECCMDGKPVNFSFDRKSNSQELKPVQRITWSITGWRPEVFIEAVGQGKCATYAGKVGFYPIDRLAGHIIKTKKDLEIAEALYHLRNNP